MPLILTLFLLVFCLPVAWPEPWLGGPPWLPPALTAALTAAAGLHALRAARRAVRLLDEPFRQSEALIGFHRARVRQAWITAGAFSSAVLAFGWGWWVQAMMSTGPDEALWPGAEAVILAPLLLMILIAWLANYRVDRRVGELCGRPPQGRGAYVVFQFRQHLALALIPVVLVVAEQSLARAAPNLVDQRWFRTAALAALLGLLFASPWGLRVLLGMRPLPAGPLRDRLTATARRVGLRFSDLLVWNTRGTVGNAMVAGVLPRPRYVMFTDRLLAELTPDELDAVLGHEVGHIRHRHLLLYLVFLSLSLTALSGLARLSARAAEPGNWMGAILQWLGDWQVLLALAAVAAYVVVAFGFLSRRCEREADLFGCRAVSCGRPECTGHAPGWDAHLAGEADPCPTGVDVVTTALERVAVINGVNRSRPGWLASWQHSTIAARVEFLSRLRNDPGLDRRYRRRLRWVKAALLCGVATAVVLLYLTGDLASAWSL
jgi:Zn-dependent protease with chaperone function